MNDSAVEYLREWLRIICSDRKFQSADYIPLRSLLLFFRHNLPDFIEWSSLMSPDSDYDEKSINHTFSLLESEGGVPRVLTASESITAEPSSGLSKAAVLTYLSQNVFFLPGGCIPESLCDPRKLPPSIECKQDTHCVAECFACHKQAGYLERIVLSEGKRAVHRKCFQCKRCEKALRRGLYAVANDHYECLRHEHEDLVAMVRKSSQIVEENKGTETITEQSNASLDKTNEKPVSSSDLEMEKVEEKNRDKLNDSVQEIAAEAGVKPEEEKKDIEVEVEKKDKDMEDEKNYNEPRVQEIIETIEATSNETVENKKEETATEPSLLPKDEEDNIETENKEDKEKEDNKETENKEDKEKDNKEELKEGKPTIVYNEKADVSKLSEDQNLPEEIKEEEKPSTTESVSNDEQNVDATLQVPVPPPRRKKKAGGSRESSTGRSPAGAKSLERPHSRPPPPPKPELPPKPKILQKPEITDLYPDDLNPFGSDDEEGGGRSSGYNSSLNPFADDSDTDDLNPFGSGSDADSLSVENIRLRNRSGEVPPPVAAKRLSLNASRISPQPDSPRRNTVFEVPHRKKRHAPLPPSETPKPLKPPRPPRPRQKRPAPPPPVPFRRQVVMEEELSKEDVEKLLAELDLEQDSLEEEANKLWDLYLAAMGEDIPEDQLKFNVNIQKWLETCERKCKLIQREAELTHSWQKHYLDELHSDVEYQLRCIIEKPDPLKTDKDSRLEARLLLILLDVIERKNKLIESQLPPASWEGVPDRRGAEETEEKSKEKHKKKKLKLRLKTIKRMMGDSKKQEKKK